MSGFRFGICDQLFTTRMPVPRAEAGGLMIHLVFFWLYLCHVCLSRLRSWGMMKVRGINPNSFLPWRDISDWRFLQQRSFLPIWKLPGRWLNFWYEWRALKQGDFMCFPHVPTQSFGSERDSHLDFVSSGTDERHFCEFVTKVKKKSCVFDANQHGRREKKNEN